MVLKLLGVTLGTTFLYENEKEEQRHSNAIEMLAKDLGISVNRIHYLYEMILKEFIKDSKIKDYLPILVSRRVKDIVISNKL